MVEKKHFYFFVISIAAVTLVNACVTYKQVNRAYEDGRTGGYWLGKMDARICMAKAFEDGSIVEWYWEAQTSGKPIQETLPAWADGVLKDCQDGKN